MTIATIEDGDMPIDEAWLASEGWEPFESNAEITSPRWWSPADSETSFGIHRSSGMPDCWILTVEEVTIPLDVRVRKQLRALVAAWML